MTKLVDSCKIAELNSVKLQSMCGTLCLDWYMIVAEFLSECPTKYQSRSWSRASVSNSCLNTLTYRNLVQSMCPSMDEILSSSQT